MKDTYEILRGNFSQKIFKNKIDEVIIQLSKMNNLSIEDFKLTKVYHSSSYSVNLESFIGQYIEYDITKEKVIIGQLGCFMDDKFSYINIE